MAYLPVYIENDVFFTCLFSDEFGLTNAFKLLETLF